MLLGYAGLESEVETAAALSGHALAGSQVSCHAQCIAAGFMAATLAM
jgi:hypothetical protein